MTRLAALALLIAASCAAPGPKDLHLRTLTLYPESTRIPSDAVLHLGRAFCESYPSENGIELGPSVCENARAVISRVFTRAFHDKDGSNYHFKALHVSPTLVYFSQTPMGSAWKEVQTSIALEWRVTDATGRLIWLQTIAGQSEVATGTAFEIETKMAEQVQLAMDDLFTKSYNALHASPEIRSAVALSGGAKAVPDGKTP
jgi:hypothetical protein